MTCERCPMNHPRVKVVKKGKLVCYEKCDRLPVAESGPEIKLEKRLKERYNYNNYIRKTVGEEK
jgi:hypothetical protein